MIKSSLERGVNYHFATNEEEIDFEALVQYIEDSYLPQGAIKVDDIRGRDYEDIVEIVLEKLKHNTMLNKKTLVIKCLNLNV